MKYRITIDNKWTQTFEDFYLWQDSFNCAMGKCEVVKAEELIDGKWELIREHYKEL